MNIMSRYTARTLRKNKLRTMVTIIGIILSTAMFTGVTSIVSSLQQYIKNLEIASAGYWEGRVNGLDESELALLRKKDVVTDSSVTGLVGYSRLESTSINDKCYLEVESIDNNMKEFAGVQLSSGRMPKNSGELIVSSRLESETGIAYQVGDTVTLSLGERSLNGEVMSQQKDYFNDGEELVNLNQKTYTIVGICTSNTLEFTPTPSYLAFTTGESNILTSDLFFTVKDPRKINKMIRSMVKNDLHRDWDNVLEGSDFEVHKDLLRFSGVDGSDSYQTVLVAMASFLILIIMIASVTLIYNAFSISINERTKQFGLLKSVGATKRQIRHSVYFEAFSLCAIGIPIGVCGGLVGIGITLHFVGNLMTEFMSGEYDQKLTLSVYPFTIVIAVVVAIITVLISALIPARRAIKMTAIASLRESRDVRIRSNKIRSGFLVRKLFGFEGTLANKNIKRNRKKYRMTIFSLVISVFLFVSSSAFNMYIASSLQYENDNVVGDISALLNDKEAFAKTDVDGIKKQFSSLEKVDEVGYSKEAMAAFVIIDKKDLDPDFYKWASADERKDEMVGFHVKNAGDKVVLTVNLEFVDDASYQKYLETNHLDVSKYMDTKQLAPLVWDSSMSINQNSQVQSFTILRGGYTPKEIYCINQLDGYAIYDMATIAGGMDLKDMSFTFAKETDTDGEEEETDVLPEKKAVTKQALSTGVHMDVTKNSIPYALNRLNQWNQALTITLPYSAFAKCFPKMAENNTTQYVIQAKNYKAAYENLQKYLRDTDVVESNSIVDVSSNRESIDASRALIQVVNIFAYGFIVLISLIVTANVFNTISTNIQLRRKEFAMLKSVGMTKKGFDRMMNYECLLYGLKGLLYGLPLSFLASYGLRNMLADAIKQKVLIPWGAVAIVVFGVFLVVFVSMLYSMRKIRKENPIDALKNDSI